MIGFEMFQKSLFLQSCLGLLLYCVESVSKFVEY